MSRTKNVSRNIFWGILNQFVTLGMPFFTRTIMVYTLGMEYVGLGGLFTSILQVLSFAELGFGSAITFSMYKPIATGDDAKVCALLNLYKKAYRIIGMIILLVGLSVMPFLDHLVKGSHPAEISLQVMFLIYLANNLAGYFLFAYKQSLFVAAQRMDAISKVGMVLHFISGVMQIIILLTIKNYYVYVLMLPIRTILNNLFLGILADKTFPQYKCEGSVAKSEKREIEKKIGGLVFQKIGGIVLSSVDTIVISAFLGLTSLALYQNYYYIISVLFAFLTIATRSMIAGVGNSVAAETVDKNYKDFNKLNLVYMWIISWCTTCLLCLYQPFMSIWVGPQNMLGTEMVFLFAVYFFIYKWCGMLFVYQQACGIWWETKFIPLVASIVNLIVNLILVNVMGLPGILISTIVAVFFIYNNGNATALFKTYFGSIENGLKKYWCRQAVYFLIAILSAGISFCICRSIMVESSMLQLLINGCVCLVVPNAIFILACRRLAEFDYAYSLIKKAARKLVKH